MIKIRKLHPKGITADSRKVREGFVFVAVKGSHVDGFDLIDEAIERGAKVIVAERKVKVPNGVTFIKVSDSRAALGVIASDFFGNPSQKMTNIGVTGTDGKTTTASLIYHILTKAGKKVGLVSTVEAIIGNKKYDTGFHVTNPDAVSLQEFLAKMVKEGCLYAVLEVTSHGIAQKRIAGISFDIAVLTNITHEHLDYHRSFSEYKKTKLAFLSSAKKKVIAPKETSIDFFEADFNNLNAQTAVNVAKILGVPESMAISSLQSFKLPEGRLQKVYGGDFDIYIDFAHTPNALEKALSFLRTKTKEKLIAVFGSAGERDATKRPLMGKAAAKYADMIILTAEDPRTETVALINSQIKKGVSKNVPLYGIENRQQAINFAIQTAKTGDLVGIFGKGHEKSMNLDGIHETPWSDAKAVQKALKYRKKQK